MFVWLGGLLGSLATSFTACFVLSLPGIVFGVLRVLGIGFVSYTGISFAVDAFESYIYARMGDMPANMLDIMNLAGLDVGIKMIIAAWTAHISIKLTMGAFNAWSTRPAVLRA